MKIDQQILDILACPICKQKLVFDKGRQEFICNFDKLAFPIIDDVPVLMVEHARPITEVE